MVENNAANGQQPGQTPAARPDWAPEKYWDATAGQVKVEELARDHAALGQRFAGGAAELRKTIEPEIRTALETERLKARPAEAAAYDAAKVTLPKGVNVLAEPPKDRAGLKPGERYALIPADDPFVTWWRETAWAAGLPQEAFADGLARYASNIAVQVPGEAEVKAARDAILAGLGENGAQRMKTLHTTLKGWLGDDVAALDEVVQSPQAIMALERLVERAGGPKFAGGGTGAPAGGGEGLTLAKLREMQRDPRYRTDDAFRQQVTDGYLKLYPKKAG